MLTWTGHRIITQIKELQNVKKITIATAFFSRYGLNLLKEQVSAHNLKPNDVTESPDIERLQSFFDTCRQCAVPVDSGVIDAYQRNRG